LEDRNLSEKGFNATIFQCIDRALSALGENAKLALFHQIFSEFGLESSQFRSRPLEVANCLHKILGDVGYSFIEKLIIREINATFNLQLRSGTSLTEAVSEAQKKFLS